MTSPQREPVSSDRRRAAIGLSVAGIAIVAVIVGVFSGVVPDQQRGRDTESDREPSVDADHREGLMVDVQPTMQTDIVSGSGDVADSAVVWLHPTDRSKSLILAGTKDENGGLHVLEIDGTTELEFLAIGAVNSIDIRYGFPYGGELIDLIALTNRSDQEVQFFTVDPATREVGQIGSHSIDHSDIYGLGLAHDRSDGTFYSIPNTEDGTVEQWEISADGTTINATMVRTIDVGSQTEGVVADDVNGWLFVGEENVGIWKYELDPSSGSSRAAVDSVSDNPDLAADVEGLTMYHESQATGYLIASSQGNSRFMVYERDSPHDYLGSFAITDNPDEAIDGVTSTDGIFVTNRDTSAQFPNGVFVAHDGETSAESTNYKLVPWERIASALKLRDPDPNFDPRGL